MPEINYLYTNDWLLILFYVNNIIVLYYPKYLSKYKTFENKFTFIYKIYVLGDIENFLNIRIFRNRSKRKFTLILNRYIEKIVD